MRIDGLNGSELMNLPGGGGKSDRTKTSDPKASAVDNGLEHVLIFGMVFGDYQDIHLLFPLHEQGHGLEPTRIVEFRQVFALDDLAGLWGKVSQLLDVRGGTARQAID